MSKAGERIIRGVKEAIAVAKGEADPTTYRIHVPLTERWTGDDMAGVVIDNSKVRAKKKPSDGPSR